MRNFVTCRSSQNIIRLNEKTTILTGHAARVREIEKYKEAFIRKTSREERIH
jgi:hypothetical protein